MSTTTTTTTRDRGDRYGPIEWANKEKTLAEYTYNPVGKFAEQAKKSTKSAKQTIYLQQVLQHQLVLTGSGWICNSNTKTDDSIN